MNILIFAHFYPPEMGGAGARLHGLARWLAHDNNHVTVITGFPNYPSGVIGEEYRGKLSKTETLDGVEVVHTWIYATPKSGMIRRLANYFSFVFASLIAGILLRRSYDVVLVSSPPLFLGISGWLVAALRRIPMVFDIRDLWPEVAVEAGEFAPDSTSVALAERLADFLYARADQVTPVTENKRQKLLSFGVPETKITVVSNGVDLDQVEAATDVDLREELGLESKFVALYAGLLGIAQGVDVIIDAAEQLRDEKSIHFVVVGDGVCKATLVEKVETQRLTNVTMLPRQPREQIAAFLNTADVCLVPLVSEDLADAVPSKLLEAWAYSRPVVLAAGGEAADIVRECNGGLVVPSQQPQKLADSVRQLSQQPDDCAEYARQGHAYVRNHLDRRLLAAQMEQVLANVVNQRLADSAVSKVA